MPAETSLIIANNTLAKAMLDVMENSSADFTQALRQI